MASIIVRKVRFAQLDLNAPFTADFSHGNSMQFLWQQNRIKFQTCSKPLRYHGDKSQCELHMINTCDLEVATLAQQKLYRVAATKMACANGPLGLNEILYRKLIKCEGLEQSLTRILNIHGSW